MEYGGRWDGGGVVAVDGRMVGEMVSGQNVEWETGELFVSDAPIAFVF